MTRYYKRLGAGKRTKLAQTPIAKLRGSRLALPVAMTEPATGQPVTTLDLRKPANLKKFADIMQTCEAFNRTQHGQFPSQESASLFEIVRNVKPAYQKGHMVFLADFSKYHGLQKPGYLHYGLVIVDSRVPENLRSIITDHEIREKILIKAKYQRQSRNEKLGSHPHSIAVRREIRDAQRKGTLNELLQFLKENYPIGYAERLRALQRIQKKRPKE